MTNNLNLQNIGFPCYLVIYLLCFNIPFFEVRNVSYLFYELITRVYLIMMIPFNLSTFLEMFLKYSEEKKTVEKKDICMEKIVPLVPELKELYEMVLGGYMDRITQYLDELEQKEKKLEGFCNQFRALALDFQDVEIEHLLKEYLSKVEKDEETLEQ